jgi:hypothetical protein
MKNELKRVITKEASKDIRKIVNSNSTKNSTSYKLSNQDITIKFSFTDIGEDSHRLDMRTDKERYRFEIRGELDDSSKIPEYKELLSDLLKEILPSQENHVNQDYPTKTIKYSNNLTRETLNKNLS